MTLSTFISRPRFAWGDVPPIHPEVVAGDIEMADRSPISGGGYHVRFESSGQRIFGRTNGEILGVTRPNGVSITTEADGLLVRGADGGIVSRVRGGRIAAEADGQIVIRNANGEIINEEIFATADCGSAPFIAILVTALIITGALLFLFLPQTTPIRNNGDSKSRKDSSTKEKSGSEFAFSSASYQYLHDALASRINPEDGWISSASMSYVVRSDELIYVAGQLAEAGQEVNSITQNEGEQVDAGKETIENASTGLQLAMPISESLYFSGPIGPIISYNFQLAVANSGIGVSVDTTNKMHENSRQHGEKLAACAHRYDQLLQVVTSANI